MNKLICAVFGAVAFICFSVYATEISTQIDPDVVVQMLYVGDFNQGGQGMMIVECTNGKIYGIQLGTVRAELMYASIVSAKKNNRPLYFFRSASTIAVQPPSLVPSNCYELYRVAYAP
jgi:hypothetical protein